MIIGELHIYVSGQAGEQLFPGTEKGEVERRARDRERAGRKVQV